MPEYIAPLHAVINDLKANWMGDDLSPLFDFEWKYLTILEIMAPISGCCPCRIEWYEETESTPSFLHDSVKLVHHRSAHCQRKANHTGDHVALEIPRDSGNFKEWKIARRWNS